MHQILISGGLNFFFFCFRDFTRYSIYRARKQLSSTFGGKFMLSLNFKIIMLNCRPSCGFVSLTDLYVDLSHSFVRKRVIVKFMPYRYLLYNTSIQWTKFLNLSMNLVKNYLHLNECHNNVHRGKEKSHFIHNLGFS